MMFIASYLLLETKQKYSKQNNKINTLEFILLFCDSLIITLFTNLS